MQLLMLFYPMRLKKYLRSLLSVCVVICLCCTVSSAYAIGKWKSGVVSHAPWKARYTYISVNDTRYTIMKDAKIVSVSKIDRDSSQKVTTISSLHTGDEVVFLAEGNRIYLIKRIR